MLKEPLSDTKKRVIRISIIAITIILIIVTTLTVGLLGKNITYTIRLTPPSLMSQLDDAYIYYYSQIVVVMLGMLFVLSLAANNYIAFRINKKKFKINLAILAIFWFATIFVTIAFLTGSSSYQDLMERQASTPSTWSSCNQNICNAAVCARLNSYEQARKMAIAFSVIASVLGLCLMPLSYLINSNRIQQLHLLQR